MSLQETANKGARNNNGENEDDPIADLKAAVAEEETKRLVADVPRSQHNAFSGQVAMQGLHHKYVLQALAKLYIEDSEIRERANEIAERLG